MEKELFVHDTMALTSLDGIHRLLKGENGYFTCGTFADAVGVGVVVNVQPQLFAVAPFPYIIYICKLVAVTFTICFCVE